MNGQDNFSIGVRWGGGHRGMSDSADFLDPAPVVIGWHSFDGGKKKTKNFLTRGVGCIDFLGRRLKKMGAKLSSSLHFSSSAALP
jgi:hypothetical protein